VPCDVPRVLLVNPWIHGFAAYDFWARPLLGLLAIAARLRAGGLRVSWVDCLDRFHPRLPPGLPRKADGRGAFLRTGLPTPTSLADVTRRYARYGIDPAWLAEDLGRLPRPDLVLVGSGMTYGYPGVRETIRHLRAAFPGVPVWLGGIYATLCPEHARRFAGADRVFSGPAETELCRAIAEQTGFSFSGGPPPDHLDAAPWPAYDLERRIPAVALRASRGCPFACAYCASRLLEPARRLRSPASVVAEIAHWHRGFGVTDFVLYDDAFLSCPEGHGPAVLEAIAAAGLPVRLHTPNALHARGITRETARLLGRAGFVTVRLGVETTDFARRAGLDRKIDAEDFRRAAEALRAAGYRPPAAGAYLLAGLPGWREEEIVRSIDAVHAAGLLPILAWYSPIPGTALWPQALAASRYDLASDPLYADPAIVPCRKEPFDWGWITRLKAHLAA